MTREVDNTCERAFLTLRPSIAFVIASCFALWCAEPTVGFASFFRPVIGGIMILALVLYSLVEFDADVERGWPKWVVFVMAIMPLAIFFVRIHITV